MEALRLQPRLNRLALLLQLQSLKHVYAFIKDDPLHFSCHFVGRPFFLLLFTLHCTYIYIPKLYHILYIFYPWNIQIHRHRNLQMAPGRTQGLNQREILSRTVLLCASWIFIAFVFLVLHGVIDGGGEPPKVINNCVNK